MSATVVAAPTILPGVARPIASPWVRPTLRGKFLWVGEEKFYIRGVTYGPFRPDADGCTYPLPEAVDRDFTMMAAAGINAIRTYNSAKTVFALWCGKGARILGFEALGVFRVSWSCLAALRTPESRRFRDDYRVWRLLCALP